MKKKVGYQKISYTSFDGTEITDNWICHPSCPVGLLDKQSGRSTSSSDPLRFSNTPKYKGTHYAKDDYSLKMERPIAQAYGDTGGASRFYPQFKSLSECLDWIDRLINSV